MMHLRRALTLTSVLVLALALAACGDSVTQRNFDKIGTDMSRDEVISILGKPTESSSMSLGGVSGTAATWEGAEGTVTIQFVNEKVVAKQFTRRKKSG